MNLIRSKKGYIPALAALAIVIIIFILIATYEPAVKETAMQLAGAVAGK